MATTLLLSLLLLMVGINITANRRFGSFIVQYLFYKSSNNLTLLRLLGIGVLASAVLLILNLSIYALMIDTFVVLFFLFFTIQGRAKRKAYIAQKKAEQTKNYQETVDRRKAELDRIRAVRMTEIEQQKSKPQSVRDIRNKMWNDGKMTNKEILENLNKKK